MAALPCDLFDSRFVMGHGLNADLLDVSNDVFEHRGFPEVMEDPGGEQANFLGGVVFSSLKDLLVC